MPRRCPSCPTRAILLPLLVGAATACENPLDSESGLSDDALEALAEQFTDALTLSFESMGASPPSASVEGPAAAATPVNVPFSSRLNCTAGGRMEVSGSVTGNIDDNGSGILLLQGLHTITDWRCIGGFVLNGDPYLSMTGNFSFLKGSPATQQTVRIGGGFKWGARPVDSCSVNLTVLFDAAGNGSWSGTVCGRPVG